MGVEEVVEEDLVKFYAKGFRQVSIIFSLTILYRYQCLGQISIQI